VVEKPFKIEAIVSPQNTIMNHNSRLIIGIAHVFFKLQNSTMAHTPKNHLEDVTIGPLVNIKQKGDSRYVCIT